jgi:hypothetical protein
MLAMGPGAYREYIADPRLSGRPGAIPVPLGKHAKRTPAPNEPLPDALPVDENLQVLPDEDQEENPTGSEVTWVDSAIRTKIKEFKYLGKDEFVDFIDANRDLIMGWPREVRVEIAKKLDRNLLDMDPGIDGFVIDEYLG